MLDIKQIVSEPEMVREKLAMRGSDIDIDVVLQLEHRRKAIIAEVEDIKRSRNEISKQVGILKKEGKDTSELQQKVKENHLMRKCQRHLYLFQMLSELN